MNLTVARLGAILDALNAHPGPEARTWVDVVLHLPELDLSATRDGTHGGFDRLVLLDGTVIVHDAEVGEWVWTGRERRPAIAPGRVAEIVAALNSSGTAARWDAWDIIDTLPEYSPDATDVVDPGYSGAAFALSDGTVVAWVPEVAFALSDGTVVAWVPEVGPGPGGRWEVVHQ